MAKMSSGRRPESLPYYEFESENKLRIFAQLTD